MGNHRPVKPAAGQPAQQMKPVDNALASRRHRAAGKAVLGMDKRDHRPKEVERLVECCPMVPRRDPLDQVGGIENDADRATGKACQKIRGALR